MPDWTRSMQQTYEFMIVNPLTWVDQEKLTDVIQATITRDLNSETQGSASIDCDTDLTDTYVRIYLKTIQDGVTERFPLGTFLCQTPGQKFDGKKISMSADGYTPLIELKEKPLPYGYALRKTANILENAVKLARDNMRAPVQPESSERSLQTDFVSDVNDTYLSFLSDLLANDNRFLGLDEMGRVIFPTVPDISRLQPRWTYSDDNSSILYPELQLTRDLYGVPNVVEVLYSSGSNAVPIQYEAVNDDPDSITSIQSRGRRVVYRDTNPNVAGSDLSYEQIKEYAENELRNLSSLEYQISYTHGYCPVRIGDCVRLNYSRSRLIDIKAKVIQQIINCTPGCPVQETAVFSEQLWG